MLKELKFVMGAVSKKDLVPAMTHFCIEDGHVRSFNGIVALSSPIPFDINCKPKAETLYRAIENCEDTITLYMTPGGKLGVKSGPFRALVSCIEESAVHVEPEGEIVDIDGDAVLKAFKVLEPIIGDDAARSWQAGILLKGQSAYATCNVVVVEYWTGVDFGHVVNIPLQAVREVIRVNEPPTCAQLNDNSFTFHFSDGRWIRTQLLTTEWPDLTRILDKPHNASPIDARLFVAMDKLKKLSDKMGRMYITDGVVHTHDSQDEGSAYALSGCDVKRAIFSREMFTLLNGLATEIDLHAWPKPCLFFGERLRGAIVGMVA